MANKEQIYAGSGTLANLSITCQGDEDVFRAKLINLERIDAGKQTKATYARVPFDQDYVKKALFFFDTTTGGAANPPAGSTPALSNGEKAEVYLNNVPSTISVFREK